MSETTYLKKHRASGFKVGDRVKIARKDAPKGWCDMWTVTMEAAIGLVGKIIEDCNEGGFKVAYSDTYYYYYFPYSALERVYEGEILPKPHELKTVNPYFTDVWNGQKTAELRFNDRNFQVGEKMVLNEYDKESDTYSGRFVVAVITNIVSDYVGLMPGFVMLSFLVVQNASKQIELTPPPTE